MTVLTEGRQAFMAHKVERLCPYSDLPRKNAWLHGWREAQKELENSQPRIRLCEVKRYRDVSS